MLVRLNQVPFVYDDYVLELISLSIHLLLYALELSLKLQVFIHDMSPLTLALAFSVLHLREDCPCSD
jgi:hypothetical protein